MAFPVEFFELNIWFAQKVCQVTGLALADALREYSHVYLSLNLSRDFNPDDPIWQAYLAGLASAPDLAHWTHQFYRDRIAAAPKQLPALEFGCFSYAQWEAGRIRIHFRSNDSMGASPLSRGRSAARQEELRAMFYDIREQVPDARSVVGGSWLYAIEAYRRLFPPAFLASATTGEAEPQFMAQWGQFLDHRGQVKPALASRFLAALEPQTTLDGVLGCFPYPVLRLECPIAEFYTYFMI